jgi:hypothetical protein
MLTEKAGTTLHRRQLFTPQNRRRPMSLTVRRPSLRIFAFQKYKYLTHQAAQRHSTFESEQFFNFEMDLEENKLMVTVSMIDIHKIRHCLK